MITYKIGKKGIHIWHMVKFNKERMIVWNEIVKNPTFKDLGLEEIK